MRHLLKATVIVGVIAAMLPATAQDEGPPVPVEKAAYHWPVFNNEYIMLLRVVMTPGKGSNYHVHSLDQISVLVGAGANAGQVYGKERVAPKAGKRGAVSFTPYSKKGPFTHRSTNMGTGAFDNIVVALLKPGPGDFKPQAREVSGYTQIFDNERARAWRLILEPGATAPDINQTAPGLRIVLDGDELTEIAPGQMDRGLALRTGEFFWQEAGAKRAVRNTGSTRLELVEFELK
jgi:quercetin dioxygenase-like cupin family protein